MSNIKRVLEVLLRGRSGPVTPRPKFTTVSIQQDENKRELLYTLMGALLGQTFSGSGCMQRWSKLSAAVDACSVSAAVVCWGNVCRARWCGGRRGRCQQQKDGFGWRLRPVQGAAIPPGTYFLAP